MKNSLFLSLMLSACCHASAQPLEHEWKVTLNVIDESGSPVAGANAGVGYYGPGSEPARIDGLTDPNGIFVASHTARPGILGYDLGIQVQKAGYYTTRLKHDLGQGYDPVKWNPNITLTLKAVRQPIAMYARKARIEVPVADKAIGFDLLLYDWVAPYGKGVQSDILFDVHRRWVSRADFDSTLKVSFPNSGDGLSSVLLPYSDGSDLRMSAIAPESGYSQNAVRIVSHTPAAGWQNNDQVGQNYYLRVRTVLNADGSVKSALYGKVYGDFVLDPINSKKSTCILFQYYLNPEPNSRNVEFDPKQNLLKGIKEMDEQVHEP